MPVEVIYPAPAGKQELTANNHIENGVQLAASPSVPQNESADALPALPTFSFEVGYREVYDAATQTWQQQPLTLLDLLFPTEDDIGVVKMAQSPWHDILTVLLATMLRTYLGGRGWLITQDVLIHWGRKGAPPASPDVAVIYGGHVPEARHKSYRIGRDGPLPAFVIEITSEETRSTDLETKKLNYAAFGVKEYLIIDLLTPLDQPWQLFGYRLENEPFYQELTPDAEGGFTFTTVNLRFVGIGRERIEVYDTTTGVRLLTPDELKARAEAEAKARVAAEARADELMARLRELEARYGVEPNASAANQAEANQQ